MRNRVLDVLETALLLAVAAGLLAAPILWPHQVDAVTVVVCGILILAPLAWRAFAFWLSWHDNESSVAWIQRNEITIYEGAALGKLRDLGLTFVSVSTDWAPAQIFELLREQGLVAGKYKPAYPNRPRPR